MGVVVERTWDNRSDDRVTTLSDGAWATATDRALTIWREGAALAPIVADADRRGPLTWFDRPALIGWGPSVLRAREGSTPSGIARLVDVGLEDIGAAARRHFTVELGATGDEGRRLVALIRRRPPRVRADRAPAVLGPASRLALFSVERGDLDSVLADELRDVTVLAWGDGPLLIGCPGRVHSFDERNGALAPLDLPTASAPQAIAVDGDGHVAAGLADGCVTTWSDSGRPREPWTGHDGSVRSVAWSPRGLLATGGEDGWLRVWSAAASVAHELAPRAGARAVEAITWLDERRLLVKIGGQAGELALVEVQP